MWLEIADRAGVSKDGLRVESVAGDEPAVLRTDREAELALSTPPPDWSRTLADVSAAAAAAPAAAERQRVCEDPEVWTWVVGPGDARRWTPSSRVRLQAVAGKAFVETEEDDVVLKGTKQLEVSAGVELRVTVPETTVLVIMMLTKAAR